MIILEFIYISYETTSVYHSMASGLPVKVVPISFGYSSNRRVNAAFKLISFTLWDMNCVLLRLIQLLVICYTHKPASGNNDMA